MEFYHMINRGVEKRAIVLDDGDRARFVSSLYELNNVRVAPHPHRSDRRDERREKLVHIHAWCLMDNHYHLLVSPTGDEPERVSRFAQKINMGYAKFFNEKYSRTGVLWQGVFKKIKIERDAHFNYIPLYIHLNPLDYKMPEWRRGQVNDSSKALEFLKNYRWSSYLDYIGRKNFPSLINKDLIGDVLGNQKRQEKEMSDIIQSDARAAQSEVIEM